MTHVLCIVCACRFRPLNEVGASVTYSHQSLLVSIIVNYSGFRLVLVLHAINSS